MSGSWQPELTDRLIELTLDDRAGSTAECMRSVRRNFKPVK